jgi:hypothetical protein
MAKRVYFIPRKDTEFFSFQKQLVDKIVANKVAWGIPDAAVNPLVARRSAYEPLHRKSQEKKDRTSGDVDRHRQSRKTYEKEIRKFVNAHIRFNDLISDSQRVSLSVPPRDTKPTPRGKIESSPTAGLIPMGGGSIEVICRRETDQDRPSMHQLADAIECRYVIVPTRMAINDPEAATKSQISKKAKFWIQAGDENAGKHFYGFFRWVNLTNPANSGPWSNAQSVIIA